MNKPSRKWIEKFGDFLLDVGKYVLTAIVFGTFFTGKIDTWQWLLVALVIAILLVVMGLIFANMAHDSKDLSNTEIKKAVFHINHAEIAQATDTK